jgi:small subunit ribosomal protein S5
MSLVALVVVGDGKGNVGLGMGKSTEVPQAIQKGVEDAKKNMFKVAVTESGSIPHPIEGRYGAGRIVIRPAVEGTGVIAGGPVRPLFELAGIRNVISKSLGTNNALNVIKAAGLKIDTLEYMNEEYKRTIAGLEAENAKLRQEQREYFMKVAEEAMPNE